MARQEERRKEVASLQGAMEQALLRKEREMQQAFADAVAGQQLQEQQAFDYEEKIAEIQREHARAIASLGRAIAAATTDREKASSLAVRAEILSDADKPTEALADCQAALDTYRRGAVDWFLLRSDLQEQLGVKEARLEGLKAGHSRTRSAVLYNAWVEALIDTGDYEQARPIIEEKLVAARLKSSWLLRRAKLRQATSEDAAAEGDLLQAIEELNTRINPGRPDLTLLVDRGIAWTMLGDRSAAKRDLAAAKKAGADRWATAPLERALGVELQHP